MSIASGVDDKDSISIRVISHHLPVPSPPPDHAHGPLFQVELGREESGVLPAFFCCSHHSLLWEKCSELKVTFIVLHHRILMSLDHSYKY